MTCYPASVNSPSDSVPEAIQPRSSRTVGYGSSGGESPLSFDIQDEMNTDVCFIKVFFTTTATDLSYLPQGTPFDEPLTLPEQNYVLPAMPVPMTAIVFPVIQRRA